MRRLMDISEDIKKKREELRKLESEYDSVFKNNKTLELYYSEKAFCEDEMKMHKYRIGQLEKLIYLEECGVDTNSEYILSILKCEEGCESYKYEGYDACKRCDVSYDETINDLYLKEYNKRNIQNTDCITHEKDKDIFDLFS